MKWQNLKSYLCPKCSSALEDTGSEHHCSNCEFRIGKAKFDQIVNDKFKGKREIGSQDPEKNLSELNNMEW